MSIAKTFVKEIYFLAHVIGLYVLFIYWGYVQEKLTSHKYAVPRSMQNIEWDYPIALNLLMAIASAFTAAIAECFFDMGKDVNIPFSAYYKAALSCAIASPLGYASLKYISFPLMVLTKSSKPVPVMLIGILFYQQSYSLFKYISVLLMCGGVSLYAMAKNMNRGVFSSSDALMGSSDATNQIFGLLLVFGNLALDGYTNNEQDKIFKQGASSIRLMKSVNLWQAIYLAIYLILGVIMMNGTSEAMRALNAFMLVPEIRMDIFWFCVCASVGQLLIFSVMKEYGSLVWITVSITRKLMTILLSVIVFNHSINQYQWLGVVLAFLGMVLEIYGKYQDPKKRNSEDKKDKEKMDDGFVMGIYDLICSCLE